MTLKPGSKALVTVEEVKGKYYYVEDPFRRISPPSRARRCILKLRKRSYVKKAIAKGYFRNSTDSYNKRRIKYIAA